MLEQKWPEIGLSIPNLHAAPFDNLAQIEALIEAHKHKGVALVGSSMGGFYATYLAEKHQLKAAVINPAVAPSLLLLPYVGEQEVYYTGETFTLTQAYVDALAELYVGVLSQPEHFFLLCQQGDETLDYQEAVAKYQGAKQEIQPGGSHAFDNFEAVIPKIIDFLVG